MKTPALAFAALLLVPALIFGQERPDFARDIQPILSRSCFECHGNPATDLKGRSKKPKAGVRLDGKSFIMAARGEPLVKAGKPAESLLYELISLPKGDPDLMPPDDEPLKPAELALIRTWIEQGADFGAWEGTPASGGAKEPAVEVAVPLRRPSRALLFDELGRGLEPLPAERLAAIAGKTTSIEPIARGSGLYRVSFSSHEAEIDDAALKALAPIADRIVELRLARTKISDKGMAVVARMNRLVKLDLRETTIGDAGLKTLVEARELRSLNLFATKVGDGALPHLVELPRLESVFLWKSGVTAEAVAILRKRLPDARIVFEPRLPEPDEDAPAPRRRRRTN